MNHFRNIAVGRIHASPAFRVMLFVCLAGSVSANAANYVFTQVDYPGLTGTNVTGINATGAIVGNATDSGGNTVAFVYSGGSGGSFTPLPTMPGGLSPYAWNINDGGTVVGTAAPADGSYNVGFLLYGSNYTLLSHPPQTFVEVRSISTAGVVTGDAWDNDAAGNPINSVGFIYDPSTASFTDIVVPGATSLIVQGINAAGQVTGNAFFNGGARISQGFLRDPATGVLTLFQVNGQFTRARGINDNGLIAGFVYGLGGLDAAFVGTSAGYQLLQPTASAVETYGEGINNNGQISGFYIESDGTSHGFIGTPAYPPAGTTSAGAYVFAVDVIPDTPVFIDPAPALGFDYATGNSDPLFTSVRLPIGIGDNRYTLIVGHKEYPLAGGQLFDFTKNGFPGGVSNFRVTDIEISADLDPNDPNAFPTQIAFSGAGRFTGSMTPLCLKHALPPQANAHAVRALLRPCGN